MKDSHVKHPNDPGPLVPGSQTRVRFTLLPGDDHDVRRVRNEVAEGGRGLFVVEMGGTGVRSLIEAYYPEDIRSQYARRGLDRFRKADFEMGRLVCVNDFNQQFIWQGDIPGVYLEEIKRNHRNARRELRRSYDQSSHVREMENKIEEDRQGPLNEFSDWYASAMIDTLEAHKVKNTIKRR